MSRVPLALEIALHYHICDRQFPRLGWPVVEMWHRRLRDEGLLTYCELARWEATPKLAKFIQAMCEMPADGPSLAQVVEHSPEYEMFRDSQRKLMELVIDREEQVACLAHHVRQAEGEKQQLQKSLDAARSKLRDRPLAGIPYDHLKAEIARRDAYVARLKSFVSMWPTPPSRPSKWVERLNINPLALRPLLMEIAPRPTPVGRPWTRGEESRLVTCYRRGVALEDIARMHGREWQAIVIRLYRLSVPPLARGKDWSDARVTEWRDQFFDSTKPRARFHVGGAPGKLYFTERV